MPILPACMLCKSEKWSLRNWHAYLDSLAHVHVHVCGIMYIFLMLGAHAHEGYSTHFVCVCVCLPFSGFIKRSYKSLIMAIGFVLNAKDFQLTDFSEKVSFKSYIQLFSLVFTTWQPFCSSL